MYIFQSFYCNSNSTYRRVVVERNNPNGIDFLHHHTNERYSRLRYMYQLYNSSADNNNNNNYYYHNNRIPVPQFTSSSGGEFSAAHLVIIIIPQHHDNNPDGIGCTVALLRFVVPGHEIATTTTTLTID
jgi:hypothetical protein